MSTLNVSNISDGTDTVETGYVVNGSAKAYCTFNGTSTIAVSSTSFNISALTDNGVGLYRTNFTNNMEDGEHVDAFACRENTATSGGDINRVVNYNRVVQSVSYTDLTTQTSFTTPVDVARVCVVTHGDLA